MSVALIGQLGIPLVTKLLGKTLSKSKEKTVSTVGNSLLNLTTEQSAELSASELHEQYITELRNERTLIEEVNATIRAEVNSEDKFVRRWRPAFGYCTTFCFISELVLIPVIKLILLAKNPELSSAFEEALGTPTDRATIWGFALSILGIGTVSRSNDKKTQAGMESGLTGLVKTVLKR